MSFSLSEGALAAPGLFLFTDRLFLALVLLINVYLGASNRQQANSHQVEKEPFDYH